MDGFYTGNKYLSKKEWKMRFLSSGSQSWLIIYRYNRIYTGGFTNKPPFLLRITVSSEVSADHTPPISNIELPVQSVETALCSNNQQQKDIQNRSHQSSKLLKESLCLIHTNRHNRYFNTASWDDNCNHSVPRCCDSQVMALEENVHLLQRYNCKSFQSLLIVFGFIIYT